MGHDGINDLLLERYLLGELPETEKTAIESALRDNPRLSSRLQTLLESNQDILSRYPVEVMTGRIMQRCLRSSAPKDRRQIRRLPKILKWTPLLAAACLVFVLMFPDRKPLAIQSGPDHTIAKGNLGEQNSPRLTIYHKVSAERVIEIKPDSLLRPGDLIQIAYSPGTARYGVILSIDGRGTVTFHHPENPDDDAVLSASNRLLLPNAYELDNAPMFERFFFITSLQPFTGDEILDQFRLFAKEPEADRLNPPLGDDFSIFSITVKKQ